MCGKREEGKEKRSRDDDGDSFSSGECGEEMDASYEFSVDVEAWGGDRGGIM